MGTGRVAVAARVPALSSQLGADGFPIGGGYKASEGPGVMLGPCGAWCVGCALSGAFG